MKTLRFLAAFCCTLLAISACKKETTAPVPDDPQTSSNIEKGLTVTATKPLTVITIAGKPNVEGYQDGTGTNALFTSPFGIGLTNEGDLFVADVRIDKIRKVTQSGVVSTVEIPDAVDGSKLVEPYEVKQASDGTIAIYAYEFEHESKYRFWICKPGRKPIAVAGTRNGYYGGFSPDPYNNFYWVGGTEFTTAGTRGFIEKLLPGGKLGVDTYFLDPARLSPDDLNYPAVFHIFAGYNGVKYLVVNNSHIYKYTPSGELTRIFANFTYGSIDDLIANKDSKTIYVASAGRIYSIWNNQIKYLVGPRAPKDGHDGVGNNADVAAYNLALSKDENTIYFTDPTHRTIRKLLLK